MSEFIPDQEDGLLANAYKRDPDFELKIGIRKQSGISRDVVRLTDLETEHLEKLLITQSQLSAQYHRTILEILRRRFDRQIN